MAEARISVDLDNPGQVFACLGFLEAAEVLIGDAEGGFDWSDESDVRFTLRAQGEDNPVETVLNFLATAKISRLGPMGYKLLSPTHGNVDPNAGTDHQGAEGDTAETDDVALLVDQCFPSGVVDRLTLPVRLVDEDMHALNIGHWADGSSRDTFKLYSGNRSGDGILRAMLQGTMGKQKGTGASRRVLTKGVAQLWELIPGELVVRPFHCLTPMGGSFNFDPRGAWTAIDAGYSPNDQGHDVVASPVVELLAALGMENARPDEFAKRKVRYSVWGVALPAMLARAALAGAIPSVPTKRFRFDLELSGKNKVVTFAILEKSQ